MVWRYLRDWGQGDRVTEGNMKGIVLKGSWNHFLPASASRCDWLLQGLRLGEI
jgi:hypothetical protein